MPNPAIPEAQRNAQIQAEARERVMARYKEKGIANPDADGETIAAEDGGSTPEAPAKVVVVTHEGADKTPSKSAGKKPFIGTQEN